MVRTMPSARSRWASAAALAVVLLGCAAKEVKFCNIHEPGACGGQYHSLVQRTYPWWQLPKQGDRHQCVDAMRSVEARPGGQVLGLLLLHHATEKAMDWNSCYDTTNIIPRRRTSSGGVVSQISFLGVDVAADGNLTFSWRNGSANPFQGIEVDIGTYSSSDRPGLDVADWNGDGHLDVLVGTGSGEVRYFPWVQERGAHEQKFGEENPFADVNLSRSVRLRAADWDGDGALDLLLGTSKGWRFLAGQPNGGVAPVLAERDPFAGIEATTEAFSVGDWDGDGDADLLVGRVLAEQRSVYGGGSMTTGVDFYERVDDDSLRHRKADMNPFSSLKVDGHISFLQPVSLTRGRFFDMAVFATPITLYPSPQFHHYRRKLEQPLVERESPFEVFNTNLEVAWPSDEGCSTHDRHSASTAHVWWDFVDWDADGDFDLVRGGCREAQFLENRDGTFVSHGSSAHDFSFLGPLRCHCVRIVDWDGDGQLDVLASLPDTLVSGTNNFGTNNSSVVRLFRFIGGRFVDQGLLLDRHAGLLPIAKFAVGDFNADGTMDLIVASGWADPWNSYPARARYFQQLPRGGALQERVAQEVALPGLNAVVGMTAVDMDGDGRLDLIYSWPGLWGGSDGRLLILKQLQNGSFEKSSELFAQLDADVDGFSAGPKVLDFDGDGMLDFFMVDMKGAKIRMWTPGSCALDGACNAAGFCDRTSRRCLCAAGYSGADCSSCAGSHWTSSSAATTTLVGRVCSKCPGMDSDSAGVCTGRGVCMDDALAKTQSGWHLAAGRGTCNCSEPAHFTGPGCGLGFCPAGKMETTQVHANVSGCVDCPAGTTGTDGLACTPCLGGRYSAKGASTCQRCPVGRTTTAAGAGVSEDSCLRDIPFEVLSAALIIFVALAAVLLQMAARPWVPIEDVTVQDGRVIVRTNGRHRILASPWIRLRVRLQDTKHPAADDRTEPFLVEVLDGDRFALLGVDGQSAREDIETSLGVVRLCSPLGRGVLALPFSLWLLACSATAGIVAYCLISRVRDEHERAHVAQVAGLEVLLGVALGCAAVLCLWWRRRGTALSEMHRRFRETLPKTPEVVARGPGRAVDAEKLHRLYTAFAEFVRSRNMYYVSENIVKPLTSGDQVSYAELAGPSPLKWFVSHFWGMPFGHFVEAVRKHALSAAGEGRWGQEAYWVCTVSNNQWRVNEELGHGDWRQSSFYLALQSEHCRATCMILDENVEPLKRSWCLFETYWSLQLTKLRGNHFQGLLFCTAAGVLNDGAKAYDVAINIANCLSTLDVKEAKATSAADKEMIDRLVGGEEQDFNPINSFVSARIRSALHRTRTEFNKDFQSLDALLHERIPDEKDGAADLTPGPPRMMLSAMATCVDLESQCGVPAEEAATQPDLKASRGCAIS